MCNRLACLSILARFQGKVAVAGLEFVASPRKFDGCGPSRESSGIRTERLPLAVVAGTGPAADILGEVLPSGGGRPTGAPDRGGKGGQNTYRKPSHEAPLTGQSTVSRERSSANGFEVAWTLMGERHRSGLRSCVCR